MLLRPEADIGRDLVVSAAGCMEPFTCLADILDEGDDYWMKKIDTPRYVVLTGFYDGGEFPLEKRDGLRVREWILDRLDNTGLGIILQGGGSLLKSSEWWGSPFATELLSRVTVMEFSE